MFEESQYILDEIRLHWNRNDLCVLFHLFLERSSNIVKGGGLGEV